jgi:hypothetical protein
MKESTPASEKMVGGGDVSSPMTGTDTGGNPMKTEERMPEKQLTNPMTTRWTNADFRLVADTAWMMRVSTSELVRRLVLEALRKDAPAAGQATGNTAR